MTGRPATDDVIPGAFALSVGMPDLPAPDGWRWVKLTDVARLESGHTPSRKHPEYWDGDIRWLGIQDARQHHGREIHETRQTVSELGIANSSARILPAGTVCLSRTASVGYVVRLGRPMATSQDFVNWVCSEDVDPEFLMYLLIAEAESILRFGKGSTHTTVYFPEVKAFHVCLPQPEEQHRIVAKVEALLARVSAARARLARVPAILKRFRQSVLAAACSGRLTEDWRSSKRWAETAQDLLARIRPGTLGGRAPKGQRGFDLVADEPFDLPKGWAWAAVGNVCSSVTDGDHQPPPKAEGGVPFVVISKIRNGILDLSRTMFVPRTYFEQLRGDRRPRRGDVLFSVTGSLGITLLVDTDEDFCFQRHIALLRPHQEVSSAYLSTAVGAEFFVQQAVGIATGIAQPTVPLSGLRLLRLPIPPREEQYEIVRRVETLFALADTIEQRAAAALRRADRLTQSILSKAFRGELTGPLLATPEGAGRK